jgi:hypothetical protein
MPNVARMVDEIRKHFGEGVKVIYAKENGYELGTPFDRSKLAVPNVCEGAPKKKQKR